MGTAPGIKLGRTDTTLDLSHMAKEAEEKKKNYEGGGGVFVPSEREGGESLCLSCLHFKVGVKDCAVAA